MVGGAMVRDLAQRHDVPSTDFSSAPLEPVAGVPNVTTQMLDCTDAGAVRAAVAPAKAVRIGRPSCHS